MENEIHIKKAMDYLIKIYTEKHRWKTSGWKTNYISMLKCVVNSHKKSGYDIEDYEIQINSLEKELIAKEEFYIQNS